MFCYLTASTTRALLCMAVVEFGIQVIVEADLSVRSTSTVAEMFINKPTTTTTTQAWHYWVSSGTGWPAVSIL